MGPFVPGRADRGADGTGKRRTVRVGTVFVLLMALIALASCSGGTASGPPEINYGRDVCDQCHMIISEARFAAAYRDVEGKPFIFDDIGDMLAHLGSSENAEGVTAWVHDYESEEWIDVENAWLVHSKEIETPMGGGMIAFADRADAERYASTDDAEVVQWKHVLENIDEFSIHEGHGMTGDDGMDGETTDHMTDGAADQTANQMTDEGDHG